MDKDLPDELLEYVVDTLTPTCLIIWVNNKIILVNDNIDVNIDELTGESNLWVTLSKIPSHLIVDLNYKKERGYMRYGRYVPLDTRNFINTNMHWTWKSLPYDQYPPEFKTQLLLLGVD